MRETRAVPMKGKWAQGIQPRNFAWIMKDQLAVCERPGGYGANHRRVRRQEEIIWIREQGFTCVVSLIPSPHNLHNYDELGVTWRHLPVRPARRPAARSPARSSPSCAAMLAGGRQGARAPGRAGDRVAGLMAGYLLWSEVVPLAPQAISVVERLLSPPDGPARPRPRRPRRHHPAVARPWPPTIASSCGACALAGIVGVLPAGAGPAAAARGRPRRRRSTCAGAGGSDALDDTVDYGALCDVVEQASSTTTRFALLEALAERIAADVLAADARIDAVDRVGAQAAPAGGPAARAPPACAITPDER